MAYLQTMPKGKESVILARIKSLNIAGLKFNRIADNLQDIWPGARIVDVSQALKKADPDSWAQRTKVRKAVKRQKVDAPPRGNIFWTDEREAHLRKRAAQKASARTIAGELKCGRGAVVNWANKLGITLYGAEALEEQRWPDAVVAQLKRLAAAGESAGFVARKLGKTRGAVIAKADRLGIKFQSAPVHLNLGMHQAALRGDRASVPFVDAPAAKGGILFDQRQWTECAWILGPTAREQTRCCGRPIVEGEAHPYCQEHLDRSRARYQPEEVAA